MKVVLIQPPNNMSHLLGAGKIFVEPMEPLGLLYIAAVLEADGVDVEVVDFFSLGEDMDMVRRTLSAKSFDVLGISCLTSNSVSVHEIGRWARQALPGVKVVLGNLHASLFAEYYLRQGAADAVVHGEGEITFRDLLRVMGDPAAWRGVAGISFLENGELVRTGDRPRMKDLDSLPLPARHLLDRSRYTFRYNPMTSYLKGKVYAPILTSRGCVNKCTFCAVTMGRRYSKRSPENVVAEAAHLHEAYGVNFLMVMDSLFTVDRQRVLDICEGFVQRGLDLEWQAEGHVNFLDPEMLRAMRRAGCMEVSLGIESGVQGLLDTIRKGTTLENIRRAVDMIRASGMRAVGLFMLGLPGESAAMSEETIRFACSLNLNAAQFSVLTPYPGTQLYDVLQASGELAVNPDTYLEDWPRYVAYPCFTGQQPIWTTRGRTYQELSRMQKLAIRRFYLRPSQLLPRLRMITPANFWSNFKALLSLYRPERKGGGAGEAARP